MCVRNWYIFWFLTACGPIARCKGFVATGWHLQVMILQVVTPCSDANWYLTSSLCGITTQKTNNHDLNPHCHENFKSCTDNIYWRKHKTYLQLAIMVSAMSGIGMEYSIQQQLPLLEVNADFCVCSLYYNCLYTNQLVRQWQAVSSDSPLMEEHLSLWSAQNPSLFQPRV